MIGGDFARILKPSGADSPMLYRPLDLASSQAPEPDGKQQAYERGVAAGEQQVREQIGVLVERQGEMLARLIEELRHSRELFMKDADEPIAALALEIARKVLHDQADALRDIIVGQAREAVAKIREGGPMKVLVNPSDVSALEGARDAIASAFEGAVTLQIEADARISRGGCIVETPVRLVDARIETQLTRIGEALRQSSAGKVQDEAE